MKPKETNEPVKRTKAEQKNQARKYYLIGLNLNEVCKLTGTPVRTLEKWQAAEKWTELKQVSTIEQKALDLYEGGRTYEDVGKILEIGTATAFRYIKKARDSNGVQATKQSGKD